MARRAARQGLRRVMDASLELDFPDTGGRRLRLAADGVRASWIAREHVQVQPVLEAAHAAARAGQWVAGFVAYEAAPAFDRVLCTRAASPWLPLAAFFAFDAREAAGDPDVPAGGFECGAWRADDDAARVAAMVRAIHAGIAAGTYYQVNASTRLRAAFAGEPRALYRALVRTQPLGYCARIATAAWEIHSVSPELFFDWREQVLVAQPMKGTAARDADPARDAAAREALARSAKDRAENVMIVDLVRNDLSRIAVTDSVRTPALFEVQGLPTVWQMTSTVECRPRPGIGLAQVFGALFPCGSVTGAPKSSAMQAIAELECSPRGVYCGAVGVLRPGGQATFNVAIRTLALDLRTRRAECGIGSGITIQSTAQVEHDEWLAKRRFLLRASAGFELLETMLMREGTVALWDAHRARLQEAAAHFGFALDLSSLAEAMEALQRAHPHGAWRVRLLAARDGGLRWQAFALEDAPATVQVALAHTPVDGTDELLRYKTTARSLYAAHQPPPDVYDTLLWNERGEVTEFTRGNVILEIDGRRLTPTLACGLLPGVQRARLLREGGVEEAVVRVDDLERATRMWFVNAVRGCLPAQLVSR